MLEAAPDHRRWGDHARGADPLGPPMSAHLAAVAVAVAGLGLRFGPGITPGLVAAAALWPLWFREMGAYRFVRPILALTVLAVAWGTFLGLTVADRRFSASGAVSMVALVGSGIAVLVLVVWARSHLEHHAVVGLYGLGALVGALVNGDTSWKFDLAIPVAFCVLGLLEREGRRLVPAAALMVIGLYSALSEGRSLFGFCVIAALLSLWQVIGSSDESTTTAPRVGRIALLTAAVGVALYSVTTNLLLRGVFGSELQARSQSQIDTSGSLLIGGRPEWAATLKLMQERPQGYGLGVLSNWDDLMTAREGFASIRLEPGGYASNYMFAQGFRLHSIVADLWASFGWVGMALGLTAVAAVGWSVIVLIATRRAPASVIFAGSLALWYLLFGPIYTNWGVVCAAIGFVVLAKRPIGSRD